MRAWLVVVVSLASPRAFGDVGSAQPNALAKDRAEHVPPAPVLPAPGTRGTGAPGIKDTWAAGIVVTPEPHADARPWPHGMVITPDDPGDALFLHGNQLRSRTDDPYTRRLARQLAAGIDKLLESLRPPPTL